MPTWKRQNGMLGIRVAFNHEKTQWIADGTADWLWRAAEDADVPIMIFAPDAPEQIGRIAPGIRGCGSSSTISDRRRAGRNTSGSGPRLDIIAPLAKYPNVAVKLSAVPGFSSEPYPFKDMTPHLKRLIEAYGPQRCFWGTDLTHQRGKYPYRMYVEHFEEELAFLPAADRKLIMGEAILKFLDWK